MSTLFLDGCTLTDVCFVWRRSWYKTKDTMRDNICAWTINPLSQSVYWTILGWYSSRTAVGVLCRFTVSAKPPCGSCMLVLLDEIKHTLSNLSLTFKAWSHGCESSWSYPHCHVLPTPHYFVLHGGVTQLDSMLWPFQPATYFWMAAHKPPKKIKQNWRGLDEMHRCILALVDVCSITHKLIHCLMLHRTVVTAPLSLPYLFNFCLGSGVMQGRERIRSCVDGLFYSLFVLDSNESHAAYLDYCSFNHPKGCLARCTHCFFSTWGNWFMENPSS